MHCITQQFNIGQLFVERNAIEENPTYQRESAVWSPEKQELFIDSVLNNYDIPKIYFHDLRSKKELKRYAIIDGKQRLYTIYQFLTNQFSLAGDFKLLEDSDFENLKPGMMFKDFNENDRERLKNISLSVVLVQNAVEDDIEELFFRLNNGEPLNAAEKRNARGGEMNAIIRELISDDFFSKKLKFDNKRFGHLEISAKIILLEKTEMDTSDIYSDLKKKYLDKMVTDHKKLNTATKEGLMRRAKKNLSILNKIFIDKDPLLSKQAYPPLYYLFIKLIHAEYGHDQLNSKIKKFLENFQVKRQENLVLEEEKRDSVLIEFGRLMQQGTNDLSSLKDRISILRRYFLLDNPDVNLLDKKRNFTQEERHAIFILSGKKCEECGKKFSDLKEMEADHELQWKFGGATDLTNARALCSECNKRLAQMTK